MSDTTVTDVATQITYPLRTVVRTFVQWLVGLVLAFLLRKFALDFAGWSQQIVDVVTTLTWALLTAGATWLMTRPAVAKFLAGTILAPQSPAATVTPASPVAAVPTAATTVIDSQIIHNPADPTLPTTTTPLP